jgi:hypothetical protein
MAEAKDFLNPHSMLTPGLAGGLTVSISMPLALAFSLSIKWLALVISLLLGLAIMLSIKEPLSKLQRFVYYILNSLIIFSTALGAGINIDPPPKTPASRHAEPMGYQGKRDYAESMDWNVKIQQFQEHDKRWDW